MSPQQFIAKWQGSTLNERQSYQAHFADLCALVGVEAPTPASADNYCYERGVTKTGSKHGWADVWKRGHFAIEYKAPDRNLDAALKQLMTYALALDNPPLLVVCDTQIIQIHTHFTNAPSEIHTIALQDLDEPSNLDKLRWLFTAPDKFHPQRTIAQITEEAAGKFAALAQSLNARDHAPQAVAHFLNQCLFCLFAEDAELLPEKLFERLLDKSQTDPAKLSSRLEELFNAMRKGGDFALEDIHWFNGGLFENIEVLPLATSEIKILHEAAKLDWSGIEPSIFGTLFERGLDPKKRSQLGAHYTDQQSILRIINPVVVEPLTAEWEEAKRIIAGRVALYEKGGKGSKIAMQEAQGAFITYLERLKNFKVLDPACGSGNFLYLALRVLKDLEHKANLEAEQLGLHRQVSIEVSPANVLGIELNPYAAELARVTVWIGEIQWMLKNGYPIRTSPILQALDHIENRDAVLVFPHPNPLPAGEGTDSPRPLGEGQGVRVADWPTVDAIIGNPPFLGGSKMLRELGDDYVHALRVEYEGRVPGGADLVTYWFEKARAQIEAGKCQRAGLVATNSIRGGSNQEVLAKICDSAHIFNAWSDEEWINEGAAVRVSLVCFGSLAQREITSDLPAGGLSRMASSSIRAGGEGITLNGAPVTTIHADLTAGEGLNLTQAKPLKENAGICFMGASKKGAFDIEGDLARQWLKLPNPNGRSNSDVLKPLWNGLDVARRPRDGWIVDFGTTMSEADAALYEVPFSYVQQHVKPEREKNNREAYRKYWWRHAEARPGMRKALAGLPRYIATPEVAKHRIFVWMDKSILPDQKLYAIAHSDDTSFGILHSRFHELWALAVCSWHGAGNDPRYTPTTTFETFPFPEGMTPTDATSLARPVGHPLPQAGEGLGVRGGEIATAAKKLNELRNNWLNPPEWTDWVRTPEEEKAGYPLRPIAKARPLPNPLPQAGEGANAEGNLTFAADLKKRTLTNLYNQRPAWLDNAHKTLDAAVAKAYGWNDYTLDMPDEEILRRLLALNLARASSL
ncbi:MAG: class I SAM-dependent DNA methyltransferase [Gallionellaceae bacterium]|nr:MAG: class I SAM-dependent DNA methyltransferase [Gallionellaceae bacterium]